MISGLRLMLAAPLRWLLRRVFFVSAPTVLLLSASPAACIQTLAVAAKPSTQRLHLRNVFTGGRRYAIYPRAGGFRITTTAKIPWRRRRRTGSAAVLQGTFSASDEATTRVQVRVWMHPVHFLMALAVPAFMTVLLVNMSWPPAVIAIMLALLYGLSWSVHRMNAMLEATDMIWFVQRALEDIVAPEVRTLSADLPGVSYDSRDFREAWEHFYREQRSDVE